MISLLAKEKVCLHPCCPGILSKKQVVYWRIGPCNGVWNYHRTPLRKHFQSTFLELRLERHNIRGHAYHSSDWSFCNWCWTATSLPLSPLEESHHHGRANHGDRLDYLCRVYVCPLSRTELHILPMHFCLPHTDGPCELVSRSIPESLSQVEDLGRGNYIRGICFEACSSQHSEAWVHTCYFNLL